MRTDIDFNFRPHPLTGDIPLKTGVQAIEQSIKNLVLTNYYERGFNVFLGSDVKASLFENYSPLLKQTLLTNIQNTCKNFEPNAEIIDLSIDIQDQNTLNVTIYYSVFTDPSIYTVNIQLQRLR